MLLKSDTHTFIAADSGCAVPSLRSPVPSRSCCACPRTLPSSHTANARNRRAAILPYAATVARCCTAPPYGMHPAAPKAAVTNSANAEHGSTALQEAAAACHALVFLLLLLPPVPRGALQLQLPPSARVARAGLLTLPAPQPTPTAVALHLHLHLLLHRLLSPLLLLRILPS